MAVDYQQTLNPANGLARSVRVLRPDGSTNLLWTVAVDIGQERPDEADAGIDMSWVGAAGIRRAPTLARAAGEAVERSALIPGTKLPAGDGFPMAPRGASWGDISVATDLPLYTGTRYSGDGATAAVAVPAAAVDFPPLPGVTDLFDPGPSGTAAGVDLTSAANSAAKEIIERSSAMLGWAQPEGARRYALRDEAFGRQALYLGSVAAAQGVELEVIRLEEPHGHAVWMVVAIDGVQGVVGAGLGLERDPSIGVLRAVQESLQIRSLLINMKSFEGEKAVSLPVANEMDRARYWASDASIGRIRGWLARIPRAERFAGAAEPPHVKGKNAAWLESLPEHTVVDLTPRLPPAIRDMGWCVVKIFCDTLQPLRMSDALEWNVLHRGSLSGPGGLQANVLPHPFI